MKYKIISIDKLIPLEKVFPTHLKNLEEMIDSDGFILKAIIADKKTGVILDGSHRYVYFLMKGYEEVPVYFVDYYDENIRVGTELKHRFLIDDDSGISKVECVKRALKGNIFSPRTTRHFFTFRKSDINLPLDQLKKGKPKSVSHLVEDVQINAEISHNTKYIREINEEVEIIINYLAEVNETKKYLMDQVKLMKETMQTAFFPGKFHPPHLGHIQTIYKILSQYKKVILCISGHTPDNEVTTPYNIYCLLKSFFKDVDNIEVVFLNETLVEKDNLDGLPDFDVLLSGNDDVLKWAKEQNIKAEFVLRSKGFLFSGTKIREILRVDNEK
jgi:cytidyltransferase-like protein